MYEMWDPGPTLMQRLSLCIISINVITRGLQQKLANWCWLKVSTPFLVWLWRGVLPHFPLSWVSSFIFTLFLLFSVTPLQVLRSWTCLFLQHFGLKIYFNQYIFIIISTSMVSHFYSMNRYENNYILLDWIHQGDILIKLKRVPLFYVFHLVTLYVCISNTSFTRMCLSGLHEFCLKSAITSLLIYVQNHVDH